jgi:hypothetical protein
MGAAATIRHDLTAAVGPSWLASVWSSGFRGRLNFLCAGPNISEWILMRNRLPGCWVLGYFSPSGTGNRCCTLDVCIPDIQHSLLADLEVRG